MSPTWLVILRSVAFVIAIIELGLTAYASQWSHDDYYESPYGDWGVNHSSPASVNFLIFSSVWSLLALIYIIYVHVIANRHGSAHKYDSYAVLGLDAMTAIFWLAGFIALAKLVGGFDAGSGNSNHFLAAIEASVVFGAILW